MRFCVQCGAELTNGSCPKCGTTVNAHTLRFSCDGEGPTLLRLYLKTFLLSVVTLGIYSFWGRTEIRRYLYSSTLAGDDRFSWHGTGKELLLGWLKAVAFLCAFYAVYFVLSLSDKRYGPIFGALFLYGAILAVTPWVLVGVQRYRLSRTSLRGIHFSCRAKTSEFAKIYYKGLGLTIVTLGFYSPWFLNNIHSYLIRHTYYGDQPFAYDGNGKDLFRPYVAFILLLIPTLYLIAFWYSAKRHRYLMDHTTWRDARFHSTLRGRTLLGLVVTNLLLIICTLGIGLPWAVLRAIRLHCRVLTLENFTGFEAVRQSPVTATATGENMAGLLELDSDVAGGLGL